MKLFSDSTVQDAAVCVGYVRLPRQAVGALNSPNKNCPKNVPKLVEFQRVGVPRVSKSKGERRGATSNEGGGRGGDCPA